MNRCVAAVSLLAGGLMLSGCGGPAGGEPAPVSVRTMLASSNVDDGAFSYAGDIAPRVESAVGFRVAGRLIARPVDVGDRVGQGTVLAQLETAPFALALREARGATAAARAELQQAEGDVARNADLANERIVAPAQFERLRTTRDTARARLTEAQSRQSLLQDELGYATLRAPVSGVVTAVDAEVGQYLAAGQPAFRVARDGGMEAVVDVPEGRIADLSLGQPATVELVGNDARLAGRVREIAPSADPATRTFRVRVAIPDGGPARLGMTARVRFTGGTRSSAIRLPITALFQDAKRPAVWIVKRDRATLELRPITIGEMGSETFSVARGVRAGERVVTAGVHRLDVKTPVRVWDGRLP